MGAPYSGGEIHGPAFSDVAEKVDWVERFVRLGTQATEAARSERDRWADVLVYYTTKGCGMCALCWLRPLKICALFLPAIPHMPLLLLVVWLLSQLLLPRCRGSESSRIS